MVKEKPGKDTKQQQKRNQKGKAHVLPKKMQGRNIKHKEKNNRCF